MTYQGRSIPERLKKLYWYGPAVVFVALLSAPLFLVLGGKLVERFDLPPWLPLSFYLALLLIYFLWVQKRKTILEKEVIEGLPKGWHLIYRYHWLEKRYRPELVFETDFKRMFGKPTKWYRSANVLMCKHDKGLLKKKASGESL